MVCDIMCRSIDGRACRKNEKKTPRLNVITIFKSMYCKMDLVKKFDL